MEEELKIPTHVAIILDGNGRWAKRRGLPRSLGHAQGAKNVETICEAAWDLGIKYVTMYAFSTENWNRPTDEVNSIMKLLATYLKTWAKKTKKHDMRCRVIGDVTGLDEKTREIIADMEETTKDYKGLNFQIALNYGSRDEITRGVRALAKRVKEGTLQPEEITEAMIQGSLDTADIPDPDLIIRPSGEQRLSNFLLWQAAYSEFYYSDILWPDFTPKDLEDAVREYSNRNRRFGKTEAQMGQKED